MRGRTAGLVCVKRAGEGDFAVIGPLLPVDELDDLSGLDAVEFGPFGGNDHQVRPGHGMRDHDGSCAFEVDDDESSLARRVVYGVDQRFLTHVADDGQILRFSRVSCSIAEPADSGRRR